MADTVKHRPVYRNIHITQLPHYRLPAPGWVSILHRISGALLFILLPFTIWMFDASVTSEISYAQFTSVFSAGRAGLPGWFFKLVAFGLIWAYVQHFIAGLRHVHAQHGDLEIVYARQVAAHERRSRVVVAVRTVEHGHVRRAVDDDDKTDHLRFDIRRD